MARCVVFLLVLLAAVSALPVSHRGRAGKVEIPRLLELDEELDDALKIDPMALNMTTDKSVINDPDSHPIRATIYTYEDKQRMAKHPGKKTMDIVRLLAKMKQKRAKNDGTVDDIKKSWRLLEMYRVLKKHMVDALKSLGQPVPDLPSQDKSLVDASGRQWGDAKMAEDGLAKALRVRDEDINHERSMMHYKALQESPILRERAEKAALAKRQKRLAELAAAKKNIVTDRPSFCVPPGCVVLDCAPPACAPRPVPAAPVAVLVSAPPAQSFPAAPEGVPLGVQAWVKTALPAPAVIASVDSSSPCACLSAPTPCRCRQEARIVKKLTSAPESAVEGKPSTVDLGSIMDGLKAELSRTRFASARSDTARTASTASATAASQENSDCRPPLCYTG